QKSVQEQEWKAEPLKPSWRRSRLWKLRQFCFSLIVVQVLVTASVHIKANKLIALGTTDVPLDPEEQADYRANREIVENAPAYARMIDDAKQHRSFSNVVAEFTTKFDKDH